MDLIAVAYGWLRLLAVGYGWQSAVHGPQSGSDGVVERVGASERGRGRGGGPIVAAKPLGGN